MVLYLAADCSDDIPLFFLLFHFLKGSVRTVNILFDLSRVYCWKGLKRIWEARPQRNSSGKLGDKVVKVSQETLPVPRMDAEDNVHHEDKEGDD